MRSIIFVAVLLCNLLLVGICSAEPAQIAVAIELEKLAVQLRGQSDYQILDMNGDSLYVSKEKQNAFLNIKEGVLYINNEQLPNNVHLVPAADNFIEINRRIYRGTFDISKTRNNTIQVVNTLPVEDYVASVLSKEIEQGFNEQVIKAQAVAVRSRAYFLVKAGRGAYDTIANDLERGGLIYLGKDAESKESRQAVQDTAGEIMSYAGYPVFAMWHMSSGGYTEKGQEFFNMQLPYLQSVKDWDEKSQFYSWKKDFTPADLDAAFERAGHKIGQIQLLKLSKLPQTRPIKNPPVDRSSTGRLKEITVVGEQGARVTLTAQQFISILNLNSNLFDVAVGTPLPKDIIATVTDAMGNEREINRIEVNISERAGYRLPGDDENTRRISRVKDDKVVFYGYGTGQGFGLSQQGAQAMALNTLQAKKDALKAEKEKQKAAEKDKPKARKEAAVKTTKNAKVPLEASKDQPQQTAAANDSTATNTEVAAQQPQTEPKKEEVTLDNDYYQQILHYYFTAVTIEKVY